MLHKGLYINPRMDGRTDGWMDRIYLSTVKSSMLQTLKYKTK